VLFSKTLADQVEVPRRDVERAPEVMGDEAGKLFQPIALAGDLLFPDPELALPLDPNEHHRNGGGPEARDGEVGLVERVRIRVSDVDESVSAKREDQLAADRRIRVVPLRVGVRV